MVPVTGKMNDSLLKDIDYVNGVNTIIENSISILDDSLNRQTIWDICKKNVKRYTIEFAKLKSKLGKSEMQKLEENRKCPNRNLAQSAGNIELQMKMYEIKTKLEHIHREKDIGAQIC